MLPRLLTGTAILLFIFTGSASSQTTFATITGTITDSTGSLVPGATVEVTHTATNYPHSAVSNEAGVSGSIGKWSAGLPKGRLKQ